MKVPTIAQLKAALIAKGYKFFDNGSLYNLNIIGIRATDQAPNLFNDMLCIVYSDEHGRHVDCMFCTTKPGSFYLLNPDNPLGAAILVPNQYIDAFAVGLHHGAYSCLVQIATLQLYRDNDKKNAFDYEHITPGGVICGIHIHRANPDHESVEVDNWSAGCQVVADPVLFDTLMGLVYKSKSLYGNKFTYTLLDESDVFVN